MRAQSEKYSLNPLSVIFDDDIDRANNWTTIVRSPYTQAIIKINSSGYKILKTINSSPGISHSELIYKTKTIEKDIRNFLKKMIDEKIVLTQ